MFNDKSETLLGSKHEKIDYEKRGGDELNEGIGYYET